MSGVNCCSFLGYSLLQNIQNIESAETYDGVYSRLYLKVCLSYEKFLTNVKGLLKTVNNHYKGSAMYFNEYGNPKTKKLPNLVM